MAGVVILVVNDGLLSGAYVASVADKFVIRDMGIQLVPITAIWFSRSVPFTLIDDASMPDLATTGKSNTTPVESASKQVVIPEGLVGTLTLKPLLNTTGSFEFCKIQFDISEFKSEICEIVMDELVVR